MTYRTFGSKAASGNTIAQIIMVAACVLLLLVVPHSAIAQQDGATNQEDIDLGCHTFTRYRQLTGDSEMRAACPTEGVCDDPLIRDSWLVEPGQPVQTIRAFFHVAAEEDCSNPVISEEDLLDAFDSLNAQFLPYGIQFECQWDLVCDSGFAILESFAEINAMKNYSAVEPDHYLNICVGRLRIEGMGWFSMGTFPWSSWSLIYAGGIIMDYRHMPPTNYSTLTHEVGHNLGLHHTHHGTTEVSQCGPCYEMPQAEGRDTVGDLCSDTPPTIPWYGVCGMILGSDPCSGVPWPPGDPENYMSYRQSHCRSAFTQQQAARMHCWTRDLLMGWIKTADIETDITDGPSPLQVNFSGIPHKEILSWHWDFGDGNSAYVQNPVHAYNQAGLFDVTLTIEATDGEFYNLQQELIWAQAESLIVPIVTAAVGQSCRVDIYATNTLPTSEIVLPFSWAGPLEVQFDSASTYGLRSTAFDSRGMINLSPANKRGVYRFRSTEGYQLPPDSGAIVSLYFTCPNGVTGDTNPVTITSYGGYAALFTTSRGSVTPMQVAGALVVCIPGDINNDGLGPDISDLVYMVDYMFNGGPPPEVPATADVDGSGGLIDIADLVYLVDFMFTGGPAPECAI
ncbi:MAG: PKD domain-containing protein [candidate division Zixibacteria bacterium]|nr:PKD domain-containing protein [candidate division Zixibacteria bacterium]MDH3937592.1 PKD domain-containing protein [candidate division Zixibacteria bacterium]MDH4032926.1 PKD domain-containing protein [candidate division Zixibacteria bacterium]